MAVPHPLYVGRFLVFSMVGSFVVMDSIDVLDVFHDSNPSHPLDARTRNVWREALRPTPLEGVDPDRWNEIATWHRRSRWSGGRGEIPRGPCRSDVDPRGDRVPPRGGGGSSRSAPKPGDPSTWIPRSPSCHVALPDRGVGVPRPRMRIRRLACAVRVPSDARGISRHPPVRTRARSAAVAEHVRSPNPPPASASASTSHVDRDMAWVAATKRIAKEAFARGKRVQREQVRVLHRGGTDANESKWKEWIRSKGGVSTPWMSVPLGFFAGAFGSVVGVGGGVFLAPALCQACSLPPRVSSGTSLAAVVATGLCAGAHYAKEGCLDTTAAATVAVAAVATSPLGAMCTARVGAKDLRRVLGIFLMGVAPTVPIKRYLQRHTRMKGDEQGEGDHASNHDAKGKRKAREPANLAEPRVANHSSLTVGSENTRQVERTVVESSNIPKEDPSLERSTRGLLKSFFSSPDHPPQQLALMASTGALAGFASGLLGVGGGVIVTPALSLATALPQAAVLGTALVAMVPPSLAALGQHARMGNVRWKVAAGLALGTALGGTAGSRLATRAEDGILEALFCLGMTAMGWRTFRAAR